MNFFNSEHCQTKAHCHNCRDKVNGRGFRASLMKSFDDIKRVDFKCPDGMKWGATKQTPKVIQQDRIQKCLADIPDTTQGRWVRGMVKQCLDTLKDPPQFFTCKDRRAYNQRWKDKIDYYLSFQFQNESDII